MSGCKYCGSEMEYYDGGEPDYQERWTCTGCVHVCFVNSETGEIECECECQEENKNSREQGELYAD